MPVSRKLVAVVVADVVGYSRLMERDEAGTHQRLRTLNTDLIAPKIAEHGGRTVKTSGDGMLLEFGSATAALRCAVEIQREMGVRNLYVAPDDRIEFRIGINLGDIIIEGDDIIGDGVNVAARLETLAEPGGISVAAAVWEQVHEDLGIEFIDSGEQRVKNISKPIRVYRVTLGKGKRAAAPVAPGVIPPAASARAPADRRFAIAAGTLGVAAIAFAAWYFTQRTVPGTTTVAGPAPRSIIVLPLGAPADDAAMRALADSLTGDVTRALADNVRDGRVVAPSIAAAYRGKSIDARQVGRDVNVHYLLEGDLGMAGDEIIVTTRLIDAGSGRQLGSERHSFIRSRLQDEQGQLSARVTYAARAMFDHAEERRLAAEPPSGATAADLVERADFLMGDDVGDVREARKLYDKALHRDPSLVKAWIGRALTFDSEYFLSFTADRESLLAAMDRDSMQAVALDDHDAKAWYVRAEALANQSRYQAAFEANDRARALDPTSFFMQRGLLYLRSGRAAAALDVIEARRSLLGTDTDFRSLACLAHLHLGHYQQAIAECERAAVSDNSYFVYLQLTAAYAQAGDSAKAAKAKAELMRRVPDFTIARFEQKQFSTDPIAVEEVRRHVIPGLRKAGVPE